ncbi:MAG: hypothetical protein IAI48_15425 [Candidatus Eremiobacteraeota bacterium]|nr:hypothetical protein [Candidatus Eremiobacteraeota bacterium]
MIDAAVAGRLLAACCAVAAVLAAFRYVAIALQRGPIPRGVRALAIEDSVYLPGAASVHVIRAGTRRLVVARTGTQVTLLGDVDSGGERPP